MFGRTAVSSSGSRRGSRTPAIRVGLFARRALGHDPAQTDDTPGSEFERSWKQSVRQRAVLLLVAMMAWVVCIESRLVYLQVVEGEELSETARKQQSNRIDIEAGRGDIRDRNGRILAYTVTAESIAANPSTISDPAATVRALCLALADCDAKERATLLERFSSGKQWAPVRRSKDVTPEQAERVATANVVGIYFERANRRYHPMAQTAAHLIGNVSAENIGQSGLEYAFDADIRGVDGLAIAEIARNGTRLATNVVRAPVAGAALELTIDASLQHIAERELEAGVKAHRAKAGTVVVMNPRTGEILAMASYPTFNPNAANKFPEDSRRNRAVQDTYEPGSTFKIVTASAALEEGVMRPDDLVDTNPGYIQIGSRRPIRDDHFYGLMTFEDVIVKSSNVGAIKAGLRVGGDRLREYVERFGFGQTIAKQMPGQSPGLWSRSSMSDSRIASISMGYEIGVTPLQMATAVSAVANGGRLLEPFVVRARVRNGRREEFVPKVVRQVIRPATAATLSGIMEGVVERGTAKTARLTGYRVAGKTGTAKKAVPGGYSQTDFNASFVGFLPARNPAFTILVVIDTPRNGTYYGGSVAAPIFQKIAEAAVQYAGLAPTEDTRPSLLDRGPVANTAIERTMAIHSPAPALVFAGGPGLMPDLTGLAAREAVQVMAGLGLVARVEGAGFVTRQHPAPGAVVESGSLGSLELSRATRDGARR